VGNGVPGNVIVAAAQKTSEITLPVASRSISARPQMRRDRLMPNTTDGVHNKARKPKDRMLTVYARECDPHKLPFDT
jgi:hypothetical protein